MSVAKREDSYGPKSGPNAGSRASSPGEQAAACDCQKTRALGRGASRDVGDRSITDYLRHVAAPGVLLARSPAIQRAADELERHALGSAVENLACVEHFEAHGPTVVRNIHHHAWVILFGADNCRA